MFFKRNKPTIQSEPGKQGSAPIQIIRSRTSSVDNDLRAAGTTSPWCSALSIRQPIWTR
jgi:hypothetical protein